jgi:hypothetical protein
MRETVGAVSLAVGALGGLYRLRETAPLSQALQGRNIVTVVNIYGNGGIDP